MTIKKIEGLLAAAFTPFHPDGSLNLAGIPPLADKLVEDGLTGIFVCGSNGEGPNMTTEERMLVAEHFIKAVDNRMLVIVHVGHNSIAESKKLAAHAAVQGADAFSSVASFYFKPANVSVLVDCMREIASAAPRLPFYYYHIPLLTGVGMDMVRFLEEAGRVIPNLGGIKYTATTINEYQSCLRFEGGKYDILYGLDELLLPALAVGAKGAIGSTYTFAAAYHLKTLECFRNGELEKAAEHHAFMVEVIRRMLKHSPIPAQKAIMHMQGYDLGGCRLPLPRLDEKSYEQLYNDLEELDFFNVPAPVFVEK